MTAPLIRVGQTWERKGTGRKVRVTAINERLGRVELEPVGPGNHSHPTTATLRRDFRIRLTHAEALAVATCGTCGAGAGEPCTYLAGEHPDRTRLGQPLAGGKVHSQRRQTGMKTSARQALRAWDRAEEAELRRWLRAHGPILWAGDWP